MEKSLGSSDHFCILAARDVDRALALSIPACMALRTAASGWSRMSLTEVAELPTDRHHSKAGADSVLRGSVVSGSITVYTAKQ